MTHQTADQLFLVERGDIPLASARCEFWQAQLVPAIFPFSNATLWRKVKDGSSPAPVKLSPRVSAWDVQKARAGIEARTRSGLKPMRRRTRKRHVRKLATARGRININRAHDARQGLQYGNGRIGQSP
jgi:prophage regulatory protein